MFLRPHCSLISVIMQTALWLRQVLRNLNNVLSFLSLLEQVSQYWSDVSSGLRWLNTAELTLQEEKVRWKRWGIFLVHCASLTAATIKSIVSCFVGCCLQKQGKSLFWPLWNCREKQARHLLCWLHNVFEPAVMLVCVCLLEDVG